MHTLQPANKSRRSFIFQSKNKINFICSCVMLFSPFFSWQLRWDILKQTPLWAFWDIYWNRTSQLLSCETYCKDSSTIKTCQLNEKFILILKSLYSCPSNSPEPPSRPLSFQRQSIALHVLLVLLILLSMVVLRCWYPVAALSMVLTDQLYWGISSGFVTLSVVLTLWHCCTLAVLAMGLKWWHLG